MGMGVGPMGKTPTTLSEINVTPLVDVMLVLLIIFMITSSVETTRARQEQQRLLHRTDDRPRADIDLNQKVPIDLPNVNAREVNLSEEKKLVLSLDEDYVFFIGEIKVLDCADFDKKKGGGGKKKGKAKLGDEGYSACLTALQKKLGANAKLKKDKELYLRADEALPYGRVLLAMARVREAGITKFGLIAEPEE
jgi:biopolymer transport protein TolR